MCICVFVCVCVWVYTYIIYIRFVQRVLLLFTFDKVPVVFVPVVCPCTHTIICVYRTDFQTKHDCIYYYSILMVT